MKKIILSIAITAVGCGSLLAQTSTGINIGDAIKVNSTGVKFEKPIQANGLTFNVPKGGMTIGSTSAITTLSAEADNQNAVGGFEQGPTCWLVPLVNETMDLGSSAKKFRNIYAKTPMYQNNAQTLSDERYKENIKPLQEAASLLLRLRPVSFDFKPTDSTADTSGLRNKVGFIAQEVQEVLPHLVGHLPEVDIYTLDYTSIIPYLVQAFQESQAEKTSLESVVSELEEQLSGMQQQMQELQSLIQGMLGNAPQGAPASAPKNGNGNAGEKQGAQAARLYQNVPNPYTSGTIIAYELPEKAGNAYIRIQDANGKRIQDIALPQTQGMGTIEITGEMLSPGIYIYSLVVSGQVLESKRMVVAE